MKVVRELLRRNPGVAPERIDDVVFAATAQVGDQGLTLGRDVALLARLCGSDPLRRKGPPPASYWQRREPAAKERFERQF